MPGPDRSVRLLGARIAGTALVAALAGALAVGLGFFAIPAGEVLGSLVPALPVALVAVIAYLVAVVAVTPGWRATEDRPVVGGAALRAAGAAAACATAAGALAVAVHPPIPRSALPALLLALLVAAVVGWRTLRAGVDAAGAAAAGLLGAVITAGSVAGFVIGGSAYLPARWIPDLVPSATTPEDGLAQSRVELVDHYLGLLFFGALSGVLLAVLCRAILSARHGVAGAGDARGPR